MGLFSKEKPKAATSSSAAGRSGNETSFFGNKLSVKGKVSGGGNLIVMGNLEGEFDLQGEFVVAPSAVVRGEVKAVTVTVSGSLSGSLTAREKIHLEKSAVVNGRLLSPRLSMVDGASFNGELEMQKPPEPTPPPKGTPRNQAK
jgi:cytoskeletal protein CcmA (bactofilin family)